MGPRLLLLLLMFSTAFAQAEAVESLFMWNGVVVDASELLPQGRRPFENFRAYLRENPRPSVADPGFLKKEGEWLVKTASSLPVTRGLRVKSAPKLAWVPDSFHIEVLGDPDSSIYQKGEFVFALSFLSNLRDSIFTKDEFGPSPEPFKIALVPIKPKARSIEYSPLLFSKIKAADLAASFPATAELGAHILLSLYNASDEAYFVPGKALIHPLPSAEVQRAIAQALASSGWLAGHVPALGEALLGKWVYHPDLETRALFLKAASAAFAHCEFNRAHPQLYRRLYFSLISELPGHLDRLDSDPAGEARFLLSMLKLFNSAAAEGLSGWPSEGRRFQHVKKSIIAKARVLAARFTQLAREERIELVRMFESKGLLFSEAAFWILDAARNDADADISRSALLALVRAGNKGAFLQLRVLLERESAKKEGSIEFKEHQGPYGWDVWYSGDENAVIDYKEWDRFRLKALEAISESNFMDEGMVNLLLHFVETSHGWKLFISAIHALVKQHRLTDSRLVEILRAQALGKHGMVVAPSALDSLAFIGKATPKDFLGYADLLVNLRQYDAVSEYGYCDTEVLQQYKTLPGANDALRLLRAMSCEHLLVGRSN